MDQNTSNNQDDLDSILDLDGGDDPSKGGPAGPSGGEPPKDSSPEELKAKVDNLEATNKDLSEQIRQISEQNKSLSEFFDRLRGNPDEEKKKQEMQEWLKKYDTDPRGAINDAIAAKMGGLDKKVDLTEKTATVREVMRDLDKKYEVDWTKHKEINTHLKRFSRKEIEEDYHKAILDACRLAGVIKLKKATPPNFVEEPGRGGGRPTQGSDEDSVSSRLEKRRKKKSKNAFGV
jgi:hypothetical protein